MTRSLSNRLSAILAAVFFAALVLATPSTAAPGDGTSIDLESLEIPYEKIVLDNGLTVLVHEDHSVPIVAVNLWYHVGSKNEKRGRTGFAHLFEHFFFNGSENYPHGFREAMDDLGANNRNGTTNGDRTNFFEDVPVSALERTLYLEADRMGFLAGNLSQEMLERERGVVKNEKRQGENQPYGKVFGRITEAIYPWSHPYSWSTIGSMEDLDAATLEDVEEWYETYYNPNNVVLSLAGDITAERARELVEEYFAAIPPGPPLPRPQSWVPDLDRNQRERMQDRVPQTRIYRVWHAPPWGTAEVQHLKLLAGVLSGSKSSPLDRRLVYEKELATSVAAFAWERELSSAFMVMVTVKPGVDVAEAEQEMETVISELLKEGPGLDELQRARMRILAGFVRGTERLGGFGGRSDVLAESMTFGGDPHAYLEQFRVMQEADPGAVRETARRWLRASHYTMTVEPFPELAAGEETLDRSVLPSLGQAGEVRFPDVQRARLENGLQVMLLERHTVPLVNLGLAVDAGYASDPEGRAGLASLAVNLMDDGTAARDTFQIADELDALGAELHTSSGLDLSFVSLESLRANLAPALEVFADVVQNPAFPPELVALEKNRRLASIEQEKAQPIAAALRIVPELLYGSDHAYATPFTGSGYEATVRGLEREDLVQWHRRWFRPGSATLVVTGDITMDELMPAVRGALGEWPSGQAPEKNLAQTRTARSDTVFLVNKPDAPQSVIVAAHLSEPGGHERDLAMETVMRNFGGMSTSRLNRNLRLEKHWSYGSWGFLWDARGQRPFLVVAPVQTDKTKEAMEELLAEIRGVAGERPIEGEEYESIMRNMVLRLPGRFETLSSLESAAIDMVNLGYPESYFGDYATNVRQLSEESLAEAAEEFIRPGELFWVVIGDLQKIRAGVEELGYGEIVRLDSEGNPLP